ncbi:MAG: response regulator [Butyrivibrio sp.]|nr:response regulator [Butyrivibrio sp.]
MVIGEKETFLAKVLIQKINESGMEGIFKKFDVNSIGADWDGTDLVTLYMNDGDRPGDDVMHFLLDRLNDEDKMIIAIGERNDIDFVEKNIPLSLIYKSFVRPVDNADFIKAVKEHFYKAEQGEFKKTILVVDDDPSYLNLVREWIRDKYKVSLVSSGLQAIKWLGKNKADLILLDHEMPVTSGPQVLEMLRSDPETRNIPVIFLTGKSDKDSVMSVVSLKPEGYLLKTIGKKELLDKLDEFFILNR